MAEQADPKRGMTRRHCLSQKWKKFTQFRHVTMKFSDYTQKCLLCNRPTIVGDGCLSLPQARRPSQKRGAFALPSNRKRGSPQDALELLEIGVKGVRPRGHLLLRAADVGGL
jgi:hypothetical protein